MTMKEKELFQVSCPYCGNMVLYGIEYCLDCKHPMEPGKSNPKGK
jgi:uncharacterized OB-fold protein